MFTGSEDRQHAYVALTRGTDENTAYVFTTPTKLSDPAPGARPAPELARYDRLTAQAGGPAPADPDDPGTTSAVSVLAEMIASRDGAERVRVAGLAAGPGRRRPPGRPARDVDRRDRARPRAALPRPARSPRSPPGTGQQPSHQEQWLHRTLRAAELAGLDPGEILARAVAERDLTGVRDVRRRDRRPHPPPPRRPRPAPRPRMVRPGSRNR